MGLKEVAAGVVIGDLGAAKKILQAGQKNEENVSHILTLRDEPIHTDLVLKSALRYRFIRFDLMGEMIDLHN